MLSACVHVHLRGSRRESRAREEGERICEEVFALGEDEEPKGPEQRGVTLNKKPLSLQTTHH